MCWKLDALVPHADMKQACLLVLLCPYSLAFAVACLFVYVFVCLRVCLYLSCLDRLAFLD